MDRRQRLDNPVTSVRAALQGWQAGIWTAMPGIVQSFKAAAGTVEVQPAIQGQVRSPKGVWTSVNLPLCVDCPVIFPGGGGFLLTMPIGAGDEGLIVFASRCIDAWFQSGKIGPQAELRMHNLSDGFFIPGAVSKPNVAPSIATDRAVLRSKSNATRVELAGGNIINVVAPGGVNITTPTATINGDLHVTGKITADNDVQTGNIKLGTHKHGGVQSGGSSTGGPTP